MGYGLALDDLPLDQTRQSNKGNEPRRRCGGAETAASVTRPQGGIGRQRRCRQITGITGPSGVITPQYDAVGNMTAMPKVDDWDTGQTLTWDAWGRLVRVSEGATVVASCTYDALFRRVTRTTGATTRRFYYSDQWQVLEEYVGNSTTPEVRYWYGIRDINDIVRRQFIDPDDPTDLYALRDTMNVVALVNASGVVQQRMAYDAFGNTRFLTSAFAAGSNAAGWNLLFHGHYRDADTGLYQMRFRYYHPNLGVWLSRDKIGFPEINALYHQCDNNTLTYHDLLGLSPASNDDRDPIYRDFDGVNCVGFACGIGYAIQPKAERTWNDVFKVLGYTCTQGKTALECKDHCRCADFIVFYLYYPVPLEPRTFRPLETEEEAKSQMQKGLSAWRRIFGEGPLRWFDIPKETLTPNFVDFHAMKGLPDGSYVYQPNSAVKGGAGDKTNEPDNFIPTKAKPDFFTWQLYAQWCCCRHQPGKSDSQNHGDKKCK